MANFTDIFIKRPVLASVVSLLIFLLGLRALYDMPLRQFPELENTVITVTTSYPGASPQVMQGFITTPLEQSIATADGIDYLYSTSTESTSTIKAYIRLNYDPNTAFTDVMSKVAEVTNLLPQDSQQPVITKDTGETIALMYLGFNSKEMSSPQVTDYLTRAVVPKLETVPGVAQAQILGNRVFAMRIWLNPQKMAAFNVSPTDVRNALVANNFQSAPGATKGDFVTVNINADTDLHNADDFKNLIVYQNNTTVVRLKDIATVTLGAKTYDASVYFNGVPAVFIGIFVTPEANPLQVAAQVNQLFPTIKQSFPPSLNGTVVYDATKFIRASIKEVVKTIIEATLIVIVVIFLFLGSLRSIAIPVVTIPLSLVGVCSVMLAFGYSVNTLTLLAMVLAIGLVVDDSIVVVENIHRHIEEGLSPLKSALQGAREIMTPVIAMTITLAAVYAPIGFVSGLTGALFKEFAFTLAGAVIVSGVIALTLSPMMCSKLLADQTHVGRFGHWIDTRFEQLKEFYQRRLSSVLSMRPVMLVLAAGVLASCYFLYTGAQQQLAPDEDQGVLFVSATAPQYANADYVTLFSSEFDKIYQYFPEMSGSFLINGAMGNINQVFSGLILKPWNERTVSQQQIMPQLQQKVSQIAGFQTVVFQRPSLPSSDTGLPIQFVIQSTADFPDIFAAAEQLRKVAQNSGLFMFIQNTLQYDNPQINVAIDRSKAATLGITMQDIGNALATAFGGNYVNLYDMQGLSYQVIPQLMRHYRLNPGDISQIYVKTVSGSMVPLSTVVHITQNTQPNQLLHFNQLNAAILQGVPAPGHTTGDIVNFLTQQANEILPKNMTYDYSGQLRQYVQEGNTLVYAFIFAIIIIYLVLAAQFESFRDPWIILISVPMSICGALIPLYLGATTINIYSQIGLITLVGLISKHGILMVDFANKLQQHEGLAVRDAIKKAAGIRLRPILMTTAAMVVGVVPLITATGAGALSRFSIGLVIACGMAIGTLFTLFIVPTMYSLLAHKYNADAINNSTAG